MVAEAEWVNMSINHLTNSQGRGFNVYNVNDSKKHCLNSKYDHELGREGGYHLWLQLWKYAVQIQAPASNYSTHKIFC